MWNQKPCIRFELDNFSEKESAIAKTFVSGGCEWTLKVHPKGDSLCDDHLSLFLFVANRKSLRSGWKRSIKFYFVVLNQSDNELYRSQLLGKSHEFCAEHPGWGIRKTLPLSKFQEKGFLEKDRLIIEVYIDIVEAFDGKGGDVSKEKKTVDVNGFQVCADGSRLQQLEERVKNLEEIFLESKKADDADGSRVQKLEERVNSLEEVSLERKIIIQQHEERIKSLEMMISDLKVGLDKEKTESCADGFLLVDEVA